MERALLEESGDLRFMQMERIGELDCCIFEAGDAWDAQKQEFAYSPHFRPKAFRSNLTDREW